MDKILVVLVLGIVSSALAEYVQKKPCEIQCLGSRECQPGYMCKSVGCNRFCRPEVLIDPIRPIDPLRPIEPVLPECIDRCQVSSDCGNRGLCVQDGCRKVCRRGVVNPVLPIDLKPSGGHGCNDECQNSLDCVRLGSRGMCVRDGCRRVCRNTLDNPVLPVGPIVPRIPDNRCQDECITKNDCGAGMVCVTRGCRQVCENMVIIDPPVQKRCIDKCFSKKDCGVGQVCVKRGCRNVCRRRRVSNRYYDD